jgi:hypothetical protein
MKQTINQTKRNQLRIKNREYDMKLKSLLLVFVLLAASSNLFAVQLILDKDYLVETGNYNDDYLFSGDYLDFKGEANDIFFFGKQVNFAGTARLALISVAGEIDVKGKVGNGIKAAGRAITINAKSTGTSFLVGGTVVFGTDSEIKGDSFVGARKVLIKGPVTGELRIGAGEVSVENEIHGNVEVWTGQLKIPEGGKIEGNLVYHSDYQISEEEVSRVTGEIRFEQGEGGYFNDRFTDHDFDGSLWVSLLFKLSFAVLGFLLLLIPINRGLEKQLSLKEILSNSLWGLIPMFIYPSAFVISIVLVITIPLAVSLALAFVPVLFITKTVGITIIGGYIANRLNLASKNRFLYFLIGVMLYSLLSLIPFFGFFLMAFVSSIGCGLLLFSLLKKQPAYSIYHQ